MSGSTLAWGCAAAALFILLGAMAGWPLGYRHCLRHAAEEAAWQRTDAQWKRLAQAPARPAPVRPPPPHRPAPDAGPGRHRHAAGPRHAALPVAGYLPAPVPGDASPWGGTITIPAPVQAPPWDLRPPEPEPLEPTAVLPPAPDSLTDSAWTRRMAQDMDAWITEHITATDTVLKEITGGAR